MSSPSYGGWSGVEMPKQRADIALVTRGLAATPALAQALIMRGVVYVDTRRIQKPGEPIREEDVLYVKTKEATRGHDYVSRGALKLIAALDTFAIDPTDKICLDLGASTGGFTEVLLRRQARRIYAVDVGTNQLAWKIRQDPRVVVMEHCHARSLTAAMIPEPPELIVADLSFISLMSALPPALKLATITAQLVALIKPQFEVRPDQVASGGIVHDPAVRQVTCATIASWLQTDQGWHVLGLCESPITGHDGNHEYLIAAQRPFP